MNPQNDKVAETEDNGDSHIVWPENYNEHHHHHESGEHHHHHHHHHHHRNNKSSGKKIRKVLLIILAILLGILIVMGATYFVMYKMGKNQLIGNNGNKFNTSDFEDGADVDVDDDGDTIVYNGVTYRYNENIATVLFMGVDVDSIKTTNDIYGKSGQADAIYVMALDTVTGKTDIICPSRDSMVDIDVYSATGKHIGTRRSQLCLSYAYGDRRHKSCENTVKAVSRMLYGMPINTYFALDLSGVGPLTKAVGGVTVNKYDETGKVTGTEKLFGSNAVRFVQSRDLYTFGSNNTRMANQREFLQNFISSAKSQTKKDLSVPLKLYDVARDYSVSNITASKITYMATKFISNGADVQFHTVEGTVAHGEHTEFIVDNDALLKTVLEVFYKAE